jgi:hypothetical protein
MTKLRANPQAAAARLKKLSRLRPTLAIVLGTEKPVAMWSLVN